MKILKYSAWLCVFVILFSGCATVGPQYSSIQEIGSKVLLEDPTKPEKWVEYGRACLLSNNRSGAVQAFEYAIELDEKYLPAYENLALAYATADDLEKALMTYQNGLRIDEKAASLWLGYGYCLADSKEYELALQAFEMALETPAEDAVKVSALMGQAGLLRYLGKETEGDEALRRAVTLAPDLFELLNDQALLKE